MAVACFVEVKKKPTVTLHVGIGGIMILENTSSTKHQLGWNGFGLSELIQIQLPSVICIPIRCEMISSFIFFLSPQSKLILLNGSTFFHSERICVGWIQKQQIENQRIEIIQIKFVSNHIIVQSKISPKVNVRIAYKMNMPTNRSIEQKNFNAIKFYSKITYYKRIHIIEINAIKPTLTIHKGGIA